MHELSTQPNLYREFVNSKGVSMLLSLLVHENIDISSEVIEVLNELCEPDSFNESEEAIVLIHELVFIFS